LLLEFAGHCADLPSGVARITCQLSPLNCPHTPGKQHPPASTSLASTVLAGHCEDLCLGYGWWRIQERGTDAKPTSEPTSSSLEGLLFFTIVVQIFTIVVQTRLIPRDERSSDASRSGKVSLMSTKQAGTTSGNAGGAWLVLTRDISQSVRVEAEPQIRAGLVLDMDTGLVRGVAVGATEAEAVAQAVTMGLSRPAGSLPPGRPDEVLCAPDFKAQVVEILSSVAGGKPPPRVRTIEPPAEAEDIFDSFIGHMSGRPQPTEPPRPSDWALMYRHSLNFYRVSPWTRWHDGVVLGLETNGVLAQRRYAAVVMGNAGIQHGLVLYPAGKVPGGLKGWEPGRPVPTPPGTLALMLDPPSELPPELRDKAFRYGWPPDAELLPVALRLGPDREGGDPDETETQLLAVALAAVTAHDARGPIAVGPGEHTTTGEVVLGSGRSVRFSIAQEPPTPDSDVPRPRLHQVGLRPRSRGHTGRPWPPSLDVGSSTALGSADPPTVSVCGAKTKRRRCTAPGDPSAARKGRRHGGQGGRTRPLRRSGGGHRRRPGGLRVGWWRRRATPHGSARR